MSSDHEPDDTDNAGPVADADLDVIFDVCRNRRRRIVITELDRHGTTSLDNLATSVAVQTKTPTKSARISLYQNHLPKMAEADAITWDQDSQQVAPGPDFQRFLDICDAGLGAVD